MGMSNKQNKEVGMQRESKPATKPVQQKVDAMNADNRNEREPKLIHHASSVLCREESLYRDNKGNFYMWEETTDVAREPREDGSARLMPCHSTPPKQQLTPAQAIQWLWDHGRRDVADKIRSECLFSDTIHR